MVAFGTFLLPTLALAQGTISQQNAGGQITYLIGLAVRSLNIIVGLLITVALVYFIWACIQFFISADAEEKAENKQHIIYGLIGIFAIVSVWGLVGFLGGLLGIGQGGANVYIPCVGTSNGANGQGNCGN